MIHQIAQWVEHATPEELFKVGGYVVAAVLFVAIMTFVWFDTAPAAEKAGPTLADHQAEDDFASFQQMLLGKNAHTGETSRYSWMQNETDVDVFVPVAPEVDKKSVQVTVTATHVRALVRGRAVLDDDFHAEVVPPDCFWQLDETKKQKVLWLSFQKKAPKVWTRGIFMADAPAADMGDDEGGRDTDPLLGGAGGGGGGGTGVSRRPMTGAALQP
jgi:hypothetical protein